MPDPDSAAPNVFSAAMQWLDGTLLGTMATVLAVLAIASVGFLLMSGRIDVRRATQVIIGCFVLFGASSISAGMMRALRSDGGAAATVAAPLPPPIYPPARAKMQAPGAPYDPYAGAALPTR